MIEICSNPYCYTLPWPSVKETFLFSPEITLHDYDVQVRLWRKGILVKTLGTSCKARPLCEHINCHFCWAMITNPRCTPTQFWLMLCLIIYCISVIGYTREPVK